MTSIPIPEHGINVKALKDFIDSVPLTRKEEKIRKKYDHEHNIILALLEKKKNEEGFVEPNTPAHKVPQIVIPVSEQYQTEKTKGFLLMNQFSGSTTNNGEYKRVSRKKDVQNGHLLFSDAVAALSKPQISLYQRMKNSVVNKIKETKNAVKDAYQAALILADMGLKEVEHTYKETKPSSSIFTSPGSLELQKIRTFTVTSVSEPIERTPPKNLSTIVNETRYEAKPVRDASTPLGFTAAGASVMPAKPSEIYPVLAATESKQNTDADKAREIIAMYTMRAGQHEGYSGGKLHGLKRSQRDYAYSVSDICEQMGVKRNEVTAMLRAYGVTLRSEERAKTQEQIKYAAQHLYQNALKHSIEDHLSQDMIKDIAKTLGTTTAKVREYTAMPQRKERATQPYHQLAA